MPLATNTLSAGVYLSDVYIAANYPGGDADVIADLTARIRTIATNRGWTIDETSWFSSTRRTQQTAGIEYHVIGDIQTEPSNGVRYRVAVRGSKMI